MTMNSIKTSSLREKFRFAALGAAAFVPLIALHPHKTPETLAMAVAVPAFIYFYFRCRPLARMTKYLDWFSLGCCAWVVGRTEAAPKHVQSLSDEFAKKANIAPLKVRVSKSRLKGTTFMQSNDLYIARNLVEGLQPDELGAAIAHEIARNKTHALSEENVFIQSHIGAIMHFVIASSQAALVAMNAPEARQFTDMNVSMAITLAALNWVNCPYQKFIRVGHARDMVHRGDTGAVELTGDPVLVRNTIYAMGALQGDDFKPSTKWQSWWRKLPKAADRVAHIANKYELKPAA